MVWWAQCGFSYGVRRGRGFGRRAFSAACWLLWWPTCVLLLPVQAALVARTRARYYMTPERGAVLAVVATRDGWHIEDHSEARPGKGTGQARALRELVLPELGKAADAAQVPITTTAAAPALAALYVREYADLVDVGCGFPRGRRLRREPQPLP